MSAQQSNASAGVTVTHPTTGEIVDNLGQQPPEALAELLDAIRDRQAAYKQAVAALEDELRNRLQIRGRRVATFGSWEVEAERPTREAVWDPDDTEATLNLLVEDGAVDAGELTEVIRRKVEVNRTEVNKILGRLSGPAQAALEACRVWRDKGRPRVRVTRSVELIHAAEDDAS